MLLSLDSLLRLELLLIPRLLRLLLELSLDELLSSLSWLWLLTLLKLLLELIPWLL